MGPIDHAHTALAHVLLDHVAISDFVALLKLKVEVALHIPARGNTQGLAAIETNPLFALYRRGYHNLEAAVRTGYGYHGQVQQARAKGAHVIWTRDVSVIS